jgi:hypothetical protein
MWNQNCRKFRQEIRNQHEIAVIKKENKIDQTWVLIRDNEERNLRKQRIEQKTEQELSRNAKKKDDDVDKK